jgi:cysteine desulfuration protein SufE
MTAWPSPPLDSVPTAEATAAAAQAAIAEEFAFFGDWTERYQYLIDLGRKLPPFPEALKTADHQVQGCQSQVWLVASGDARRMDFHAISDSAIVSGLIALLLRVYSGRSAQDILATEPDYIQAIGLSKHLSPTRSNGLAAMLQTIKHSAAEAVARGEGRVSGCALGTGALVRDSPSA